MPRSSTLLPLAGAAALTWFAGKQLIRTARYLSPRNRNVLITGGSRGLGLQLARQFAQRGAKVAICARDPAELQRAFDDFARQNIFLLPIQADVTDRTQAEALVATAEDHLGPIDFLINNAGTITVGPFETMTEDDFKEALQTHLYAPLYTTWAVLPSMRERRRGRIINISSIGGKIPVPHLVPYVASKFALTGLSESLRAELSKDNIFVTTICPGLMRTGSPPNIHVKGRYEDEYAWFILGDSIPGLSMSANRAARQIINAATHGDPERILSLPATLAARFHGLAPELSTELMRLNRALMLPTPPAHYDTGEGARKRRGYESESDLTRSKLTTLTRNAAAENNEPHEVPHNGHPRQTPGRNPNPGILPATAR
ncbi:MAG: SDR family NAD(P)-dependent oxidoreductase, partial [Phycisphaerae bacterium]